MWRRLVLVWLALACSAGAAALSSASCEAFPRCAECSASACKRCAAGAVFDVAGLECVPCAAAACQSCESDAADACVACQPGFAIVGGYCKACHDEHCLACASPDNGTCTQCAHSYTVVDGECVSATSDSTNHTGHKVSARSICDSSYTFTPSTFVPMYGSPVTVHKPADFSDGSVCNIYFDQTGDPNTWDINTAFHVYFTDYGGADFVFYWDDLPTAGAHTMSIATNIFGYSGYCYTSPIPVNVAAVMTAYGDGLGANTIPATVPTASVGYYYGYPAACVLGVYGWSGKATVVVQYLDPTTLAVVATSTPPLTSGYVEIYPTVAGTYKVKVIANGVVATLDDLTTVALPLINAQPGILDRSPRGTTSWLFVGDTFVLTVAGLPTANQSAITATVNGVWARVVATALPAVIGNTGTVTVMVPPTAFAPCAPITVTVNGQTSSFGNLPRTDGIDYVGLHGAPPGNVIYFYNSGPAGTIIQVLCDASYGVPPTGQLVFTLDAYSATVSYAVCTGIPTRSCFTQPDLPAGYYSTTLLLAGIYSYAQSQTNIVPAKLTTVPTTVTALSTFSLGGTGFTSTATISFLQIPPTADPAGTATITTWTVDVLTASAPNILPGRYCIELMIGTQYFDEPTTLLPAFTSISSSTALSGDALTLSGAGFGTDSSALTVTFTYQTTTVTAPIVSVTTTTIVVYVPVVATTAAYVVSIGVKVSGTTYNPTTTQTVTVTAPTITGTNSPVPLGSVLSVSGSNFRAGASDYTIYITSPDNVLFRYPLAVTSANTQSGTLAVTIPVSNTHVASNYVVSLTMRGLTALTMTMSGTATIAPTLSTPTPTSGYASSSILVAGNGFDVRSSTANPDTVVVTIDGITAAPDTQSVIPLNNNEIRVIVPVGTSTNAVLAITVNGVAAASTTSFHLNAPLTLTSVSSSVIYGAIVAIIGTGFVPSQTDYTVHLSSGDNVLATSDASGSLLTFTLPDLPALGTAYTLTVTRNGVTAPGSLSFNVKPLLDAFSASNNHGTVGQTLSGLSAHGLPSVSDTTSTVALSLTPGPIALSSISVDRTLHQVGFTVPSLPAGDYHVVLTVNGIDAPTPPAFQIQPTLTTFSTTAFVGDTLTIAGTGFATATSGVSVQFKPPTWSPIDGNVLTVDSTAAHAWFTCQVPLLGAATYNVLVTMNGIATASGTGTLTIAQDLAISSVNPTSIPPGGSVSIVGTGFHAGTSGVTLHLADTTGTGYQTITVATADVHADGLVVTVPSSGVSLGNHVIAAYVGSILAGGSATLTVISAISLLGLSSSQGTYGSSLTLTGENFDTDKTNIDITFVYSGASSFTVSSPNIVSSIATQIVCDLPDARAGVYAVHVTSAGQTTVDVFDFTILPAVDALGSTSLQLGASISLTGHAFAPGTLVITLTDTATSVVTTVSSPTGVTGTTSTFAVPSSLEAGAYSITLSVDGFAATALAVSILPKLASISSSSVAPGSPIVLTGKGFPNVDQLSDLAITLTPTSGSGASVIVSALSVYPTGAVGLVPEAGGGDYTLSISVRGIATSTTLAFTIVPTTTSVAPSVVHAGDTITISGRGLGSVGSDVSVMFVEHSSGNTIATVTMTTAADTSVSRALPALASGRYDLQTSVRGTAATGSVSLQVECASVRKVAHPASRIGGRIMIRGSPPQGADHDPPGRITIRVGSGTRGGSRTGSRGRIMIRPCAGSRSGGSRPGSLADHEPVMSRLKRSAIQVTREQQCQHLRVEH